MGQEYRIKEVKIGFTVDNISTKFYPQVLISRKKIPWIIRIAFGRKDKVVEKWSTFYKNPAGKIIVGELSLWGSDYYSIGVIEFDNLKSAQEWIEEYKKNRETELNAVIGHLKNRIGHSMPDFTIHPIK